MTSSRRSSAVRMRQTGAPSRWSGVKPSVISRSCSAWYAVRVVTGTTTSTSSVGRTRTAAGSVTNKSRLPPDGQARRGFNDALRVVPEGVVEHRRFTDGTIDQVGQSPLDVASRGHIDFHRSCRFDRQCSCHDPMHGLAADQQGSSVTPSTAPCPDFTVKVTETGRNEPRRAKESHRQRPRQRFTRRTSW